MYLYLNIILLIGAAALGVVAVPTCLHSQKQDIFADYSDYRGIKSAPYPWQYLQPAPEDHVIDLQIGLQLQNLKSFRQRVIEISTPGHVSYGLHMSNDDINTMLNPKDDSVRLTLDWLESFGIHGIHDNQWVKASVTVAKAQELLQTKYAIYINSLNGQMLVRALSHRLPNVLNGHVDLVQPTTVFTNMSPHTSTINKWSVVDTSNPDNNVKNCTKYASLGCVRELYNMLDYKPTNKSKIGIAGFLKEFGNRADLQTFFKKYRPEFLKTSYTTVSLNGGLDDQSNPGSEANLDIQYIAGLTFPNSSIYYSVGGSPPFTADSATPTNTNEPYLEFIQHLLSLDKKDLPDTISISYGDSEQTVPQDYAEKVCDLFAQLGARRVSILVSSGDFGVGGGDCKTNDGFDEDLFQPTFPASCPFVTAVGGTTGNSPEAAVYFSGGGFSRYFLQPAYQSTHVEGFLDGLGEKYEGLYDPQGRGYPDVAALGDNCRIVLAGEEISIGGTSCSAPIFASVIALINDKRISEEKSPLGFLNPWLYSSGKAGLKDIVTGNNPGCKTQGFSSTAGWDPVTGLGSPDLKKLMDNQPDLETMLDNQPNSLLADINVTI
ncbi:hypothetical protein BGZ76_011365 [Entomortierella beljakovae]|nr:hypothetical protein BGZ76_011365 [Entomortierella beljakovae]